MCSVVLTRVVAYPPSAFFSCLCDLNRKSWYKNSFCCGSTRLLKMKRTTRWLLLFTVLQLIQVSGSDGILDMLSSFFDVEELAKQATTEASRDAAYTNSSSVDDTYPLAPAEMEVLRQMYRACRTAQSKAMQTWCDGSEMNSNLNEKGMKEWCPPGMSTHPCTGRVLSKNKSVIEDGMEFLRPWEGIQCDIYTDPTTVTNIYLPDEGLNCELAELNLSVMVSLEQLDLSGNRLYGVFPEWLGEMTLLRLLNLKGNQLSGDIPSSIADNIALELINLSANNLTASTLRFFDAFDRLQHLDLSSNNMELELPKNIFSSRFLRVVNFSHNSFYGDLPEMPLLPSMASIDLSANLLSGEIPPQLSLWGREDPHDPDENSTLAIIDFSRNFFTGTLPIISNQTSLRHFDVHDNAFGGILPDFPPSLLMHVEPAHFDGNVFSCPMSSILLPSNLTCLCGNGYSTKSTGNSDGILANETVDLCSPCPEGQFSNATTNQKCSSCPAGSTPELSVNGKAEHCRFCLPGTYSNESGSQTCMACLPGTSANATGAIVCESCSPGQFAATEGSTKCTECSVGTFSSSIGATSCASCPAGTYVNALGEAECLMCPIGTYQDVVGSVECKTCPVGYVAPQPGFIKCSPCPPGGFFDGKLKTCVLCPQNTFTGVAAQTACSKCGNGTVAEGVGNEKCVAVAVPGWGYLSTETTDALVKCNPGSFNDGNWRSCQPCHPGTFSAEIGSQVCQSCAEGSFSSTKGSSYCQQAPSGWFVNSQGAVKANPCPPNFVTTVNGSVECTPCQAPSFSFRYGGVECSAAKMGEVYDQVVWPRLALDFAGIAQNQIFHASDSEHVPVVTRLVQICTDTLMSYSAPSYRLHVLEVTELDNSTLSTRVLVAVETIKPLIVKSPASTFQSEVGEAVHQATEATESALNKLLDELDGSSTGKTSGDNDVDVVMTTQFQYTLVRQFNRANLIGGVLSLRTFNLSIVNPPFNSTRAVACPPGTFFTLTEAIRACRPCPMGSFSSTSAVLACKKCPQGTFSVAEGQVECSLCPIGADAASGATSCVKCSWFTYVCEGFWQDLMVAVCIAVALFRKTYKQIRRLCSGDQSKQQQVEGAALMAAVRAHGRAFDGVQYAPMGLVSADSMFGQNGLHVTSSRNLSRPVGMN